MLRFSKQPFMRLAGTWAKVPQGPPDAILGVTEAFKADKSQNKINLGVGAYRDDANKPFVLASVAKSEHIVSSKKLDKEYSGITGDVEFQKLAAELAYGKEFLGSMATSQTISGTGALRIGGDFIQRFHNQKSIFLPSPSWGNHTAIFKDSNLKVGSYRYFDKSTSGLDFKGMVEDLKKIDDGSAVLFHACAHNPTGVDPTPEQWQQLSVLSKQKKFLPFFDMAYQGFASGDCDRDAYPVRLFVKDGHQIILTKFQ
jgi:aspartate aminotransferase